jgi:undecaprenyl-diphosphatase
VATLAVVLPIAAAHNLITTFQAVVLGVLQGATELFPVSSLGHTVLFPTLFRWHNIVTWQSQPESPWLAFVVMLHVGSAIGLLIYFWRDWIAIIRAFFATLGKRRIETSTERLAWLIICATIPVGILGLVLEHPIRDALAKPIFAAIFLIVNGCVLIYAERYRRRSEVRELARREGLNPEGARRLDTLEFKEAGVIGVVQSTALIAGISRDGVVMTAGLARGLDNSDAARFGFLLATPPILAAGLVKFSDLTGPLGAGVRGPAVLAAICAALTAIVTVHYLTKYFEKRNLIPFGLYCIAFGAFMVVFTAIAGAP